MNRGAALGGMQPDQDRGPWVAAPPASFVVRLGRSGQSVRVAKGETILGALGRIGVPVPYSCAAGICGTCETRVLAGTPLHRDRIIDRTAPESAHRIMICCSRSASAELTLDL